MTHKSAYLDFAEGTHPSRDMQELGEAARAAAAVLARSPQEQRNQALRAGARALRAAKRKFLLPMRKNDPPGARTDAALLDRLLLDPKRLEAMAQGLEAIASFLIPCTGCWRNGAQRLAPAARGGTFGSDWHHL